MWYQDASLSAQAVRAEGSNLKCPTCEDRKMEAKSHSSTEEGRCARQFFLLEAMKVTDDVERAIEIAERMRRYVEDGVAGKSDAPVVDAAKKGPSPADVFAPFQMTSLMLSGLPSAILGAAERDAAARERREKRFEVLAARSLEDDQG